MYKAKLPLWLECPYITSRYSMGYGKSYQYEFYDWFDKLSKEEALKYNRVFPEPKYWKNEELGHMQYSNEHHSIVFWNDNGLPEYDLSLLKKEANAGKKIKYLFFFGHEVSKDNSITKSCFSQWWKSDFSIDEEEYTSMEQYMMAEKARLFGDEEILKEIMKCRQPKKIKALGREVLGFKDDIWSKCCYSIVLNGSYHKYLQNKELGHFLLSTKNKVLVEASPYDKIWGIAMSESDEHSKNPMKWKGQNLLGFALMEVRSELRRVCGNDSL